MARVAKWQIFYMEQIFQTKFYTDISAISVTFCKSADGFPLDKGGTASHPSKHTFLFLKNCTQFLKNLHTVSEELTTERKTSTLISVIFGFSLLVNCPNFCSFKIQTFIITISTTNCLQLSNQYSLCCREFL